jgi:hypothetical protein
MKTIEKSLEENDYVDPDKLWSAVDTKKNAAAAVYGRGPNAPLAKLAQAAKLSLGTAANGTPIVDMLMSVATRNATYGALGGLEGYREGRSVTSALKGAALALGGHRLLAVINSNPAASKAFADYLTRQSSTIGGGTAQEMTGGNEQGQTPQ